METARHQTNISSSVRRKLLRAVVIFLLGFIFFRFILSPYIITTKGKNPGTQIKFALRPAYLFFDIQIGQIVVLNTFGENSAIAAQVVAEPGQKVDIIGGDLFINDTPITKPKMIIGNKKYNHRKLDHDELLVITLDTPPRLLGITKTKNIIGLLL